MSTTLVALCAGRRMGHVERDAKGRLSFTYDDHWRRSRSAHPLSVSMPLAAARHEHDVVESFLWGLLPDNRFVLERWAGRFGVSANNVFALLTEVGEECAGAVQFVCEERVDHLLAHGSSSGGIEWLDEADLGARLAGLRRDASASRNPGDTGQFSLAGAQPKTALHRAGDRFGVPYGSVPTTHIVKPPLPEFAGHVENEHLCLTLAREAGLPAAASEVRHFGNEVAIVIERFDRITEDECVRRVHQEDFCQALAVHPANKYQSDGGPGPAAVVEVLRDHSDDPEADAWTFLRALIFNWIIGGTDAHAKNYALLHAAGSVVRLAPIYDVASILPYDRKDPRRSKLAMRIGHHYRISEVTENDWSRLADELSLDQEQVVDESRRLRAETRQALPIVIRRALDAGLDSEPVATLETVIRARMDELDRRFARLDP